MDNCAHAKLQKWRTIMKKQLLLLALLAGCAGCNSTPADTSAKEQNDIKALEDRFMTAFKAKDINAIMSCYTPDDGMVVFDMSVPLQYTGAQAYRKDWEEFFAAFPGPASETMSNLEIATGGDVAYAHMVQRASLTGADGKVTEMTVRVTDGYKKVNGQWLIAHEHVSVPIDLATLKPDMDAK
jgi:uncharacterized protein (TIGR02246 family)